MLFRTCFFSLDFARVCDCPWCVAGLFAVLQEVVRKAGVRGRQAHGGATLLSGTNGSVVVEVVAVVAFVDVRTR